MSAPSATSETNKALVQASFDRWSPGTGSRFELLAPAADWAIVGSDIVVASTSVFLGDNGR